MDIFPIYNFNCFKNKKQEVLINPYEEFLQYCYKTYYAQTGTDKPIVSLYCRDKSEYIDMLVKIGVYIPGISIWHDEYYTKFHNSHDSRFSILNKNNEPMAYFEIYSHGPYVREFTDFSNRVTLYLNFSKCTDLKDLNVDTNYNTFIFDNADVPGSLNMFICVLYGLGDFMNFLRYYKTRTLVVKNIDMFMRKLVENKLDSNYLVSYNISNFTLSVVDKDKIYTGTYDYNNYIEKLKEFKNKLTNAC